MLCCVLQALETELEAVSQERDAAREAHEAEERGRARAEALASSNGAEVKQLRERLRHVQAVRRRLHNRVMELVGNIRVFCRIRPPLDGEETTGPGAVDFALPDAEEDGATLDVVRPSLPLPPPTITADPPLAGGAAQAQRGRVPRGPPPPPLRVQPRVWAVGGPGGGL